MLLGLTAGYTPGDFGARGLVLLDPMAGYTEQETWCFRVLYGQETWCFRGLRQAIHLVIYGCFTGKTPGAFGAYGGRLQPLNPISDHLLLPPMPSPPCTAGQHQRRTPLRP